jgi:putative FmdB family regulatory protein
MPIYSYRCDECQYDLERISTIESRDEQDCRKCESRLARKIDKPGAVWNPSRTSGAMRT